MLKFVLFVAVTGVLGLARGQAQGGLPQDQDVRCGMIVVLTSQSI
jgi:hypothetical protein